MTTITTAATSIISLLCTWMKVLVGTRAEKQLCCCEHTIAAGDAAGAAAVLAAPGET
jgi:hypothetical protein